MWHSFNLLSRSNTVPVDVSLYVAEETMYKLKIYRNGKFFQQKKCTTNETACLNYRKIISLL